MFKGILMINKHAKNLGAVFVLFASMGLAHAQNLPSQKFPTYPGAECKPFFGTDYKPGRSLIRRGNALFNSGDQGLWVNCPIKAYRLPLALIAEVDSKIHIMH